MSMKTNITFASLVALMALSLQGCSTLSAGGQQVHVMPQNSNLIAGCTKLGRVSAEVTMLVASAAAENALREAAYEQYKADTVVPTNYDHGAVSVVAHGYAMRCD